jgi:hypothetical protein
MEQFSISSLVKLLDENEQVQAKREFLIKPDVRCLCFWLCSCFCFDQFVSTEAHSLCSHMEAKNMYYAGFGNKKYALSDEKLEVFKDYKCLLFFVFGGFTLLFLLMGCVKGLLGCCFKKVGRWKYDYFQPNVPYEEAGR